MNFGKKQIIMLSLLVLIIAAGYLQYNYNQSSPEIVSGKNKIGEALFVETENDNVKAASVDSVNEETVPASKQANDYFASAKMEMEVARSKGADELEKIILDEKADKEIVKKAYEAKMKLVLTGEKEVKIENLIKKIGFSDALVMFSEDGSVDVVLKSPTINESETAQITDIVCTYAGISELEKIRIKNVY